MKNIYKFLFSLALTVLLNLLFLQLTYSQPNNTPELLTVALKAEVSKIPNPQIKISWKKHQYATSYEIRRKNFGDVNFPGTPLAQFDTATTFYVDDNVEIGREYEYEVGAYYVAKMSPIFVGDTIGIYQFRATGYVYTGIEVEEKGNLGKLLLLVDETMTESLPGEISRLQLDLIAEGWNLVKKDVPRTEKFNGQAVKDVKNIILEEEQKDPGKQMYIFLLGRVAVPYSGYIAPDGHPNHVGSWPCDGYYGSLAEINWTDNAINITSASREENKNIPGDGKFDQSNFLYNPVDLPVGRVDFYNMPVFSKSETDLIKQYLDKDHLYRTGEMAYINRALIDDNFGMYGTNGFSSTAWRAFPLFFGRDSVKVIDWFSTMATDNYLWSYGCGGGDYPSAGGIGNSSDFATKQVNSIFTMLFGSYFGDWDSPNNFMRAALASGPSVLTCCWAGRPHWFLHHMDMGIPIGFSTKLSMNNSSQYLGLNVQYMNRWYYVNQSAQEVHIALMGDPTLRMYMGKVPEPTSLSVVQLPMKKVEVTWGIPELMGNFSYSVYRSESAYGPFEKINEEPVLTTSYLDTNIIFGPVYYMVRTVQVETTRSGSFKNLSRGISKTIVVSGVEDNKNIISSVSCYPNPATKEVNFSIAIDKQSGTSIEIYDSRSNMIKNFNFNSLAQGEHKVSWNLINNNGTAIPSGIYFVRVITNDNTQVEKFSVIR